MKKEKWIKWEPLEGISQTIYLQELKYDYSGLTLNLTGKDTTSNLIIHFTGFFGCRIADEGDLLKASHEVEKAVTEMKVEKDSYYKWSLFTVEDSLYLQWFHEQSLDIHINDEIKHYLILTPDDVIEVLDSEIPTVMWN